MKFVKLTALSSFLFILLMGVSSCEPDAELDKVNLYQKSDLPMTGAQSVPISNSTALGTLSVKYDKRTRLFEYTITWTGLAGNPTNIGVYGPAPVGYPAINVATGTLATPLLNIPVTGLTAASGKVTGSVLVDNVRLNEEDLLNYFYYVRISSAAYPAGEIRAQVKFQ